MGRSKPRYGQPLDNMFVELCRRYKIESFAMETYLMSLAVLALDVIDDLPGDVEKIGKSLTKLQLRHSELPVLTISVQTELDSSS
jgi:hypothetical protein